MKIKNFLLGTCLAVFALTSCSDDDNGTHETGSGVVFNTTIGEGIRTRASGNSWDGSDAIGVYMKKTGQALPGNIVNAAENMKHTTPGSGVFSAATAASEITFPGDGISVDFIAYYPYQTTINSYVYKVNVATQTSQEAIDLLYSNNATNLTKTHVGGVPMTFNHELTKVIVNVKAGAGISSLSGLNVKLTGMKTEADFALETGLLTVTSAAADITMKSTANGADMLVEAIILPAEATSGRVMTFVLGSRTYKWSVPDLTKYEKGKKYTYDAILKVDGTDPIVTPEAVITDWVDVPSETINPELETGAGGDGTYASPYSIADLTTAKVGETSKWITGYIVGSSATPKAFPSVSTNILLAASPTETDESKCIPIDITGAVQANLDIVANPSLIGKEVKVQGDILTAFGGLVAMSNLIAQEGGVTTGGGGTPEVFFTETFGALEFTTNPKIGAYTGWDNGTLSFSDSYGAADLRKLKTGDNLTNHVWLPANKDASLKIEGINTADYKNLKLSFDIAANVFNTGSSFDVGVIRVNYNGTTFNVPSRMLSKDAGDTNIFYTIDVDMSSAAVSNTSTLELVLESASNTVGVRLDNVKLEGSK